MILLTWALYLNCSYPQFILNPPLEWSFYNVYQNTSLLHWKLSSGSHRTLWWESSSVMTQAISADYDPCDCHSRLFSPFLLFSITLISCSSNRPGKFLHQGIQIPSAWNVIPLDIYIYDSFTCFRFTHVSSHKGFPWTSLCPFFFFYRSYHHSIYHVFTYLIYYLWNSKLECKTPEGGDIFFRWCLEQCLHTYWVLDSWIREWIVFS